MTQLFTVPTAPDTIAELAREYAKLAAVAALTGKNNDRIRARTAELDLDLSLGLGTKQARCTSRTVICHQLDQFNFLLSHREDRTTASWDSEIAVGMVRFKTPEGAQRALTAMVLVTPSSATEELARIDSDEEHSGSRKVTLPEPYMPADGQTCAKCGHRFDEHDEERGGCSVNAQSQPNDGGPLKDCPCGSFGS